MTTLTEKEAQIIKSTRGRYSFEGYEVAELSTIYRKYFGEGIGSCGGCNNIDGDKINNLRSMLMTYENEQQSINSKQKEDNIEEAKIIHFEGIPHNDNNLKSKIEIVNKPKRGRPTKNK